MVLLFLLVPMDNTALFWNAERAAGSLFPTMVWYLSQGQSLGISIAICTCSCRNSSRPPLPASTIALTLSTMFAGSSRSVSRVPGAPPRCDTPPTAPSPSTSITVQPVGRSESV